MRLAGSGDYDTIRAKSSTSIAGALMTTLASGLDYIDLNFLGRPGIIATAILQSSAGVALVDPGPATTLVDLKRQLISKGLRLEEIHHLLLTHIHLDHAGGVGALLRECPNAMVLVHERGAAHMIEPSRLLASATRLYGTDMDRLWGQMVPVPADRVQALAGGERILVAGRELEVAYTPGHASHHVCYFDRGSRIAFVGDTAGIRRGNYVMPPLPPPDIDLEAWRASADRILAWDPDTLFLTHFGPFHGPRPHFQELFARIADWSARVRRLLADTSLTDDQRQERFVEDVLQAMRRAVGDREADQYGRAGRLDYSWQGLARYWRKKTEVR
jgi:glyoxylase-like metal-dependent hydrolase (beta-lactamase superfamily II)